MSLNTLNCCLFIYLLFFIDILCCSNARLYSLYCLHWMFETVDSTNCLLRCRCNTSVFFFSLSMNIYECICILFVFYIHVLESVSPLCVFYYSSFFLIFHFVCATEEITYLSCTLCAWWYRKRGKKSKQAYAVLSYFQYRCISYWYILYWRIGRQDERCIEKKFIREYVERSK